MSSIVRRINSPYLTALLFIMLMLAIPMSALAFTYTYTGPLFTYVIGSTFNTTEDVTASFTLDTSGGPGSIAVNPNTTYDFTISAGGYTYDSLALLALPPTPTGGLSDSMFRVSWDAAGTLTDWQLNVNVALTADTSIQIDTSPGEDWAIIGPDAVAGLPGPDVLTAAEIAQTSILEPEGTWTSPAAPVPEPSALLLIGSGLVGFVAFKKKFRA